MFTFTDMTDEEALRKLRSFRDDQMRSNSANEVRLKALETENQLLKARQSALTRLLISKQVFTAAELAELIVTIQSETQAQSTATPVSPSSDEAVSV